MYMYKYMYGVMAATSLLVACGSAPNITLDNRSPISDDTILSVVEYTNSLLDTPVDMDGYTIVVFPTNEDAYQACLPYVGENAGGCSNSKGKTMWVWWADHDEFGTSTMNIVNGSAASTISHEMGHAYYLQTTGDSDKTHTHWDEYFNLYREGSVDNLVFNKWYVDSVE